MPRKRTQPIDTSWQNKADVTEPEPEEAAVELQMDVEPEVQAEEAEPEAAQEKDPDAPTIFRTRDQEPTAFFIRCGPARVRGGRNLHDGFVYWRVPAELVDNFRQTPHVLNGRIVEAS